MIGIRKTGQMVEELPYRDKVDFSSKTEVKATRVGSDKFVNMRTGSQNSFLITHSVLPNITMYSITLVGIIYIGTGYSVKYMCKFSKKICLLTFHNIFFNYFDYFCLIICLLLTNRCFLEFIHHTFLENKIERIQKIISEHLAYAQHHAWPMKQYVLYNN